MVFEERRRSERRQYTNSIDIYSYENKKMIGKGFVLNWCEDGFGIISSQMLEIGKKIVLFLDLDDNVEFDFLGEIVRYEDSIDARSYGIKLLPGQASLISKMSGRLIAA
jgi:hypothetical protein